MISQILKNYEKSEKKPTPILKGRSFFYVQKYVFIFLLQALKPHQLLLNIHLIHARKSACHRLAL